MHRKGTEVKLHIKGGRELKQKREWATKRGGAYIGKRRSLNTKRGGA
jgi:hypothetical protein